MSRSRVVLSLLRSLESQSGGLNYVELLYVSQGVSAMVKCLVLYLRDPLFIRELGRSFVQVRLLFRLVRNRSYGIWL